MTLPKPPPGQASQWDGKTRLACPTGTILQLGDREFVAMRACYLEPGDNDPNRLAARIRDWAEVRSGPPPDSGEGTAF